VSMTGDAQLARNKLSSLTERRIVGSWKLNMTGYIALGLFNCLLKRGW
jgi:hypothetical protein